MNLEQRIVDMLGERATRNEGESILGYVKRLYREEMAVNLNVNSVIAHGASVLLGAGVATYTASQGLGTLFSAGVFYAVDWAAYYGVLGVTHYIANRNKWANLLDFTGNVAGVGLAMIPASAAYYGISALVQMGMMSFSPFAKFVAAGFAGIAAARVIHTYVCHKTGLIRDSDFISGSGTPSV